MKKGKIFFVTLVLFTSIQACQNNLVNNNSNQLTEISAKNARISEDLKAYYPLNVGNTWTYELSQFQNEQPNNSYKEMTMSVVSNGEENGVPTAVIKRTYPESQIQPNQTLAKIFQDHIELSRYIQQLTIDKFETKGKDSITVLKLPFNSGNSWEGRVFQGGTEKIEIMGIEKVTLPFGVFDAIKVRHLINYDNGKQDNLYYWYSRDIGTIKMHEEITFYMQNQWIKMRSEGILKSFSKK